MGSRFTNQKFSFEGRLSDMSSMHSTFELMQSAVAHLVEC